MPAPTASITPVPGLRTKIRETSIPPPRHPSQRLVAFSLPRGAISGKVSHMATAWPSFFWEMDALESQLQRLPHVDKWFVKSKFSPLALRESSYFLSPSSLSRGLFRFSSRSFSSRVLLFAGALPDGKPMCDATITCSDHSLLIPLLALSLYTEAERFEAFGSALVPQHVSKHELHGAILPRGCRTRRCLKREKGVRQITMGLCERKTCTLLHACTYRRSRNCRRSHHAVSKGKSHASH